MSAENKIEVSASSEAENANVVSTTATMPPTNATPMVEVTTKPTTNTTTTAAAAAPTISEATDKPTDSNATEEQQKNTTTIEIQDTTLDDPNTNTTSIQMSNGENNAIQQRQQQQQQQQQQLNAQNAQNAQNETQSESIKDKMELDASLTNFKVLYVVTQLCGLTLIVLIGSWVGVHLGGVGGTSNPKLEFNWHPILMTIGFIFLYGNSILIYRGFRTIHKKALKITHASIHMGAFILTVIALKTAFDSHNLATPPIPNMYSLHSWLGLSAVIIFCLQYVAGFMAYLVPGLKENYKIAYMPLHIYFGLFGFVLAVASALMGITEKVIFSVENFSSLPSSGVMANMCGLLFVVFGGLVVYLATEPAYKRQPRPEDTALLTRSADLN